MIRFVMTVGLFLLAILTTACAASKSDSVQTDANREPTIHIISGGDKTTAHNYEVIDGDTLHVFTPKRVKIRLIGIDTPEIDQRHGIASKDKLEDILDDASAITVHAYDTDKHGRLLANVLVKQNHHGATTKFNTMTSVNALLVEVGLAYPYLSTKLTDEALKSQIYYSERKAKRNAIGVYDCPECHKPWEYRKERSTD